MACGAAERRAVPLRAVVFQQYGQPAEVREVPDPSPSPGGVVVRVGATGLCRSDWHGWMGHGPDIALPHVPGHELAGVVEAVGSGVVGRRPGGPGRSRGDGHGARARGDRHPAGSICAGLSYDHRALTRSCSRRWPVGVSPHGRVPISVTALLAGGLLLGGCSDGASPAPEKSGSPTPGTSASPSATASPSSSPTAAAPPPTPAAASAEPDETPDPTATPGARPKASTPPRTSSIPQNPYRGPHPPPAPPRPELTPDWTPWKPDPDDPSIPTYTVPPLP